MSTTDMAYDMTDSQTQAHVRQIFASCHVLKSVSCQLQPFKTSRSKPKRRSSPAMPLLRRCVVFMAFNLVVAMPPEGGPAAPPGGPSAPPGLRLLLDLRLVLAVEDRLLLLAEVLVPTQPP